MSEGNDILGTNLKLQINSCYGATSINTSGNSLNSIYDVERELLDFERLNEVEKNHGYKEFKKTGDLSKNVITNNPFLSNDESIEILNRTHEKELEKYESMKNSGEMPANTYKAAVEICKTKFRDNLSKYTGKRSGRDFYRNKYNTHNMDETSQINEYEKNSGSVKAIISKKPVSRTINTRWGSGAILNNAKLVMSIFLSKINKVFWPGHISQHVLKEMKEMRVKEVHIYNCGTDTDSCKLMICLLYTSPSPRDS